MSTCLVCGEAIRVTGCGCRMASIQHTVMDRVQLHWDLIEREVSKLGTKADEARPHMDAIRNLLEEVSRR